MTDLLYSAEVRWFWRGPLPDDMLSWFLPGRDTPPATRTDSYLLLPGCESVGVKQREEKFEVKALRGTSETAQWGAAVTGRVEAWVKWSYADAGVDAFITGLRQDPAGWLAVEKRRWLRKFSLAGDRPEEVDIATLPAEGVNIELTAVRARHSDWWTIGLEAYGHPHTVRPHLHQVATHFFTRATPPRPLDTTRSCSYPTWLNALL